MYWLWQYDESTDSRAAQKETSELRKTNGSKKPLVIKALSYKAFNDNGLHKSVSADLLEVRPRSFVGFNIRTINEAILKNTYLVIHSDDSTESEFSFIDFGHSLTFSENRIDNLRKKRMLGRVTRVVLKQATIEFRRDKKRIMTVVADSGLMDKKKEDARFFNATLTDLRTNRVVKSREVLWDEERNLFVIPGKYIEWSSADRVTGASVEIDMDFVITPL